MEYSGIYLTIWSAVLLKDHKGACAFFTLIWLVIYLMKAHLEYAP